MGRDCLFVRSIAGQPIVALGRSASTGERMVVAVVIRWNWLLAGIAAIAILVLAYAWADGGKEPLREMSEPVPLPETPA